MVSLLIAIFDAMFGASLLNFGAFLKALRGAGVAFFGISLLNLFLDLVLVIFNGFRVLKLFREWIKL